MRPYLDLTCSALAAAGVARARVLYTDVGYRRARQGPAQVAAGEGTLSEPLQRLLAAVADRVVEPPTPDRFVMMTREEWVYLDPTHRPRAWVEREGVRFRVVDRSGLDDPVLQPRLDALGPLGFDHVRVLFTREKTGRATIDRVELDREDVLLPPTLQTGLEAWTVGMVERQPLETDAVWIGGFVLYEVGRNAGALHYRYGRWMPTGRSID